MSGQDEDQTQQYISELRGIKEMKCNSFRSSEIMCGVQSMELNREMWVLI